MHHSHAYYIKTIFLILVLYITSFLLAQVITEPILEQNYFFVSVEYGTKIVSLMLINLFAFSLTIGAWGKWEQYVLIGAPVASAILFAIAPFNINSAILVSLLAFLMLGYDTYKSTWTKNLLIKFKPQIILRMSTSGVLFVFSALGGILVMFYAAKLPEINFGKDISKIVEGPVKTIVQGEFEKQMQKQDPLLNLDQLSETEDLDPTIKNMIEAYKPELQQKMADYTKDSGQKVLDNVDLGGMVETQVNGLIEPYKELLHPLLAVLMFGLFSFYAMIARIIYSLTIDIVFFIALKTGFLKIQKVVVEKEDIVF